MDYLDILYIKKYHEAMIEKHGSDNSHSLAWENKELHFKRFEVLCSIGDLSNASVLDAGCGNGDLCLYMMEHFKNFHYSGIDVMNTFLDNAIKNTKDFPEAKFYLGDFFSSALPPADYVLASGSLNYRSSDAEFIYKIIVKLFKHCNIGFGFNLLSKNSKSGAYLRTYSSEAIVTYCKTLSAKVILKDQYAENDFTVLMYK